MIATIPFIEQKFDEFNKLMFDGKLSRIPVELSNAKTFIGMCVFKKRRKPFGKVELYDFRLRINARIDLAQDELEDTIIHEMIHYYIGVNNIKDTSAHGNVFRQIMENINQRYGRHVTITHKSTEQQREQLQDKRIRWHVIAVVSFDDGRTGIKVLPRIRQRIENYRDRVSSAPDINSISLFFSKNPFFNKYPNSSALKVHYIDKSELDAQLVDAEELKL